MQTIEIAHTFRVRVPNDAEVFVFDPDAPLRHFTVWDDAVRAGAPDSKPQSEDKLTVWDGGRIFQPPPRRANKYRYLMYWSGPGPENNATTESVQKWGAKQGLKQTSPYEIFALSARYPKLYRNSQFQKEHVCFTRGCGFVATQAWEPEGEVPLICGVWQSETGKRSASLVATNRYFYDRTLYVFRLPYNQ